MEWKARDKEITRDLFIIPKDIRNIARKLTKKRICLWAQIDAHMCC